MFSVTIRLGLFYSLIVKTVNNFALRLGTKATQKNNGKRKQGNYPGNTG